MTKKAPRALLFVPGPIEYHEDVLEGIGKQTIHHVGPEFINIFGETLEMLRKVLLSKDAQPFVMAGSGTLGFEMIASNLIEKGENVLVINTGFFADYAADCSERFGGNITHIRYPKGVAARAEDLTAPLKEKNYKLAWITHMETSLAVKNDIKSIAAEIRRVSPNTLIAVDGVCAFGAEEFRFDEWDIDAAMAGSQKAMNVPPGIMMLLMSQRALKVFSDRQTPPGTFYSDLSKWIPVMNRYENRQRTYFGTPATNLIIGLHIALSRMLNIGMEEVFTKMNQVGSSVRRAVRAMNLELVCEDEESSSNTMSAIYYPKGVEAAKLRDEVFERGLLISSGLDKELGPKYFRISHMGISALEPERGHIPLLIETLQTCLSVCGHKFPENAGINALKKSAL